MGISREEAIMELRRRGIKVPNLQEAGLPNISKDDAMSELKRRGISIPQSENAGEYTYGERALQGARGVASGIGNSLRAASGNMNIVEDINRRHAESIGEKPPERSTMNLGDELASGIDTIAGRNLAPKADDAVGKIIHGTGEFLTPLPGAGYTKAAKGGIKAIGKLLGREGAASLGAATALEAKPKMTDEGTIGRGIEDFADTILGARYGAKLGSKSSKIASNLYKTATNGNFTQTLKDMPAKGAAKFFSKFSNPEESVLRIADQYGIDLPVNVGSRNSALNWLHNNFLKSMFSSKAYKDVYQKADEQMYGNVKKSIDTLGIDNIEPGKASARFKDFLKEEKTQVKEEANKLYNDAVINSGMGDTVVPKNTINTIHQIKALTDRDIQSPATKKVAKLVTELMSNWGLVPKDEALEALKKDDPKLLSVLLANLPKKLAENPNIEVGRLNEVRQELGTLLNHEQEVRGMEGWLNGLRNSITKDIESSSNPKFLEKWKGANKFYYDNIASRVESDLAHSMLTGDAPTEAFDVMKDIQGIKLVEKIAGKTDKGKKVFDDLKKAKVRDIIKNAVEGSYEDGTVRKAPFAKLFQKGEERQELLRELVGPNEYKKLADIAKISEEFSNSGKELLNTSGTALVGADIDRLKSTAASAVKLLLGGLGSGYSVAGSAGALAGAGASMAAPYVLSKLMANPVFVREARIYALQRKAQKELQANKTLNRLFKISESEARKSALQLNRILNQKDTQEEDPTPESME